MFLSYEPIRYISFDVITKEHSYEYKIIDSDFECVVVGSAVILGVIDEYEKRNLPVVPNLIKAMAFISKKYGYSLSEAMISNKFYYKKYQEEIDKYSLLC